MMPYAARASMTLLRNSLRLILIWTLSGVAAPYISRSFYRLARRAPEGSFVEAVMLQLSSSWSAMLVTFVAELLAAFGVQSVSFLFAMAAELRVRPKANFR
jgi:hypothetical protein